MANLIFSVEEVFTTYLGEFRCYRIPEYQRGYKWDKQQIEELLNDIDKFKFVGDKDKFYCIQNITIVKDKDEKLFRVIDGQQRLTTLVVLLSYLDKVEIIKDKLIYSVRPETGDFLKHFILNKQIEQFLNKQNEQEHEEWKKFLETPKPDNIIDYDHQDIYYLFTAYNTIRKWFKNKSESDKNIFKDKLLHHVKLIVNNPLIDKKDEKELFTNLNTGRVLLDGADLVRALLITNVAKEELEENNPVDTKNILRLNEKRVRIGLELDEISAWWNQKEVQTYFDWLDKITIPTNTETIHFDSKKYPVNLLYKLYLAKNGEKYIRLRDFEMGSDKYSKLYKEIIFLHRTIKDWYNDCEIYHFVKFLITYADTLEKRISTFKKFWNLWVASTTTRKSFITELKKQVGDSIDIININEIDNWFDNKDLIKILILLDIIQIIKSSTVNNQNNKLHLLNAEYFTKHSEDKEHIFPQTPISQDDIEKPTNELKNKVEKYMEILQVENIDTSSIHLDNINWRSQDDLSVLKNILNNLIAGKIHINSIGNLCLLNLKVNRSYGNDFYSLKRYYIIQNTRNGEYIRPHTLHTFVKGFHENKDDVDNLVKWTNKDIEANARYINRQITEFFNIKANHNENE